MPPLPVNVVARCHCGLFNLAISLAADSLPQRKEICVCGRCRHGTGSQGVVTLTLPTPPSDAVLAHLAAYEIAGGSGRPYTRYRCERCGAHALDRLTASSGEAVWGAFVGLLDRVAGVVEITGWEYVASSVDGGVSPFLPGLPRYAGEGGASDLVNEPLQAPAAAAAGDAEQTVEVLPIKCACGSVDLVASRPHPPNPIPPQLYCYARASPADPVRFLTTACACTSCRTTTGSSLPALAVTHVPFADLHPAGNPSATVDGGADLPGLVAYQSSAQTTRYCCAGACGASVGCVTAAMPTIFKLSTGVLRASEGARAERWCSWWTGTDDAASSGMPPSVNAAEEGVDQKLMAAWVDGLKQWGIAAGLRK